VHVLGRGAEVEGVGNPGGGHEGILAGRPLTGLGLTGSTMTGASYLSIEAGELSPRTAATLRCSPARAPSGRAPADLPAWGDLGLGEPALRTTGHCDDSRGNVSPSTT
jgi:hypothetical protein